MYTPDFWDKVYEQQNDRPPRTASEHKEAAINRLNEHLPENMEWTHILDYWCWNGHIWENFLQKWADVDFAEISNKMVELLRKKYSYQNEIWKTFDDKSGFWHAKIFWVESPNDLPVKNESYDYIITWALFHHVNPDNRKEFLDKFCDLLKKDWKMIIAGWDETDVILRQDKFKWHVTWQPSYTINSLPQYLDPSNYEIEETGLIDEKIPAFDIPRTLRYFIVKRK